MIQVIATDQPSSLLVGKNGAMTGPVTSSSLSNFTWKGDIVEMGHGISFTKNH